MTSIIHPCKDLSESVELYEHFGLYLKPIAKLNVCVQLPAMKMPGKSISNWEVMEKLKKMIKPNEFTTLKVIKTTLEFIRFEGEVDNKNILKIAVSRIDGSTIKLSGFADPLKVRSAEAKSNFPSRHDWDSFFRDAKHVNEMKPGERPDTIHFQNLPTKWFADKKSQDKPSISVLKKVFETFGRIRCIDIPSLDPYNKGLNKAIGTFTFGETLTFEAYVQFDEYLGFVKAMDALRGMKLMHKLLDGKAHATSITVDFDKTKYLSEKSIRRRNIEREKLLKLEKAKEDRVKKERVMEEKKKDTLRKQQEAEEKEREKRREEKLKRREERRKQRALMKEKLMAEKQAEEITEQANLEISDEQKAQAERLLVKLFQVVKKKRHEKELQKQQEEIKKVRQRQVELEEKQRREEMLRKLEMEKQRKERLTKEEQVLRKRLLKNLKEKEEKQIETLQENLRKELSGRKILKSVLVQSEHRPTRPRPSVKVPPHRYPTSRLRSNPTSRLRSTVQVLY